MIFSGLKQFVLDRGMGHQKRLKINRKSIAKLNRNPIEKQSQKNRFARHIFENYVTKSTVFKKKSLFFCYMLLFNQTVQLHLLGTVCGVAPFFLLFFEANIWKVIGFGPQFNRF